jgi:chitinase
MRNPLITRWAQVVAVVGIAVIAVIWYFRPTLRGKDTDKVFAGYLYGPAQDIDFHLYTHICHAFLVPDRDGRVRGDRDLPSRQLTDDAHKAGVRVILALGGFGWDQAFAAIVSQPEAEERYAKSVLAMVDQFDYDGIDFDWEYPDTPQEVAGFERLTRRFRKELDKLGWKKGRPMLVTMALSANPATIRWLDTAFLVETMDWINVMTYDYAGDWTNYAGHHSPLHASSKQPGPSPFSTELTMRYLVKQRGLPANRLAVGIPLYGRGFNVAEPYASTGDALKGRAPGGDYSEICKLQTEGGWVRKWDDETRNPWLISTKEAAVISYDDAESVAIKTEWAMKQQFRGVFFWQIRADRLPGGAHPLQEAALKEWEKVAPKHR